MHEFGNAGDFLFELVVSSEREHTLCEDRTALRALHCIFEQGYAFGVVRQALAQQFKTANHPREQIVKIMGDSACELANRFQFLRLERKVTRLFEFVLGFFALRQVASDFCEANDLAGWVANRIDNDIGPKL